MRRGVLMAVFLTLLCAVPSQAYEILYDADASGDLAGTLPIMYDDTNGIASTSTRWKSIRMQATASGDVTHFVVRVGSNGVGSVPFGFAVYSGTSTYSDAPVALLGRGYYASHNFATAGYYAFPFTSVTTVSVTSGDWYHLVFLLTPADEAAASAYRCNEEVAANNPAKWGSACGDSSCSADIPPMVGAETWDVFYGEPSSASWSAGLLIGEAAAVSVFGTGGTMAIGGGGAFR